MELKHLRAFLILAEELHFSRAAQKLHIVQPALSMQIKALETEIGVRLLERDKRHVQLTDAGKLFLTEARATLDQAEKAITTAQRAQRGEIGKLRIAFVSSVIPRILPALIREFSAQYPKVQLDFKDMPTPAQIDALRENRIDFGFLRMPASVRGIHIELVAREPFVVVLPEQHPLAQMSELSPIHLRDEPLLTLARRAAPGFCDALFGALQKQGLVPHSALELDEMHTMVGLVASGLGLAIVPEAVAALRPPGVTIRPLQIGTHLSEIGLAWVLKSTIVAKAFYRTCRKLRSVQPASAPPTQHRRVSSKNK